VDTRNPFIFYVLASYLYIYWTPLLKVIVWNINSKRTCIKKRPVTTAGTIVGGNLEKKHGSAWLMFPVGSRCLHEMKVALIKGSPFNISSRQTKYQILYTCKMKMPHYLPYESIGSSDWLNKIWEKKWFRWGSIRFQPWNIITYEHISSPQCEFISDLSSCDDENDLWIPQVYIWKTLLDPGVLNS